MEPRKKIILCTDYIWTVQKCIWSKSVSPIYSIVVLFFKSSYMLYL